MLPLATCPAPSSGAKTTLDTTLLALPEAAGTPGQGSKGFQSRQLTCGSTPRLEQVAEWVWTLRAWFLIPLGDLSQLMLSFVLGFLGCNMWMNPAAWGTTVSPTL